MFRNDMDTSSRMDICVYHQAPSKKKGKKRNLVASAQCTLQELARLHAQQGCDQKKGKEIEIKLNGLAWRRGGKNESKTTTVLLIAKLDLPQVILAQPACVEEDSDTRSESLSEDPEGSSSPTSDSSDSEDPSFAWPEAHHPEPKVHTGYWSDSDDAQSEDAQDPLLKHRENDPDPVPVSQLSDSEDSNRIQNTDRKFWFAASMLPTYTETISIESQVSTVDSIVDSFSPYRQLREASVDSDYERVLAELCAEWRFVGGSLVALAGLQAGVFGFSSASMFTVSKFARKAIAVGSIASGLGLAIDAWFLLAYCNTTSAKFQKLAVDVYGKYLFFCISARIPALCMFTSACALMIFLLSVAWTAWPTAVLVMSFMAGILVGLQFIVYAVHCVVTVVMHAVRGVQKGVMRCLAWIRLPPSPTSPSDVREKEKDTPQR